MQTYVALLRAVNVGGTGKLAMGELRELCGRCGFLDAQTLIQSGNVVFRSSLPEAKVKHVLEAALGDKLGKPTSALVRPAAEWLRLAVNNPFPKAAPNQVLVLFLDETPAPECLDNIVAPGREDLVLRGREIYIHFPDGMGQSKLKLPFAATSTGRNFNTVRRLAAMVEVAAR